MTRGSTVEVEVKAAVETLEEVRQRLQARGARREGSRRETDTYFHHPKRSFARTDEALRIRESDGHASVTYKGPKMDSSTKTREEVDLGVQDAEKAATILEALGFEPAGRVVKQREIYTLDPFTVTLDQVEGLGPFVEIERVVQDDVDQAREGVLELADDLGLGDRERRSYLELLLEKEGEGAA